MIVSIGEILLDVFSEEKDSSLNMSGKIGGAPFNVAANIALIDGESSFYGVIGNDEIGRFIEKEASKYKFKKLLLKKNKTSNTTIAMVSLNNGERSFSFLRGADPYLTISNLDRMKLSIGDVLNIGSLLLSQKDGYGFFLDACKYAKRKGAYVSLDANIRLDVFENSNEAKHIYESIFKYLDILKLSEDELLFFGFNDPKEFYKTYMKKSSLLFITYGKRGSAIVSSKINMFVPSVPVEPKDSTGAGDAFFARALKELDELETNDINDAEAERILKLANNDGALACTHYGAL